MATPTFPTTPAHTVLLVRCETLDGEVRTCACPESGSAVCYRPGWRCIRYGGCVSSHQAMCTGCTWSEALLEQRSEDFERRFGKQPFWTLKRI
jgi:hypothetical protein